MNARVIVLRRLEVYRLCHRPDIVGVVVARGNLTRSVQTVHLLLLLGAWQLLLAPIQIILLLIFTTSRTCAQFLRGRSTARSVLHVLLRLILILLLRGLL